MRKFLLIPIFSFFIFSGHLCSQKTLHSFKSELKKNISEFENQTQGKDQYKHVNTLYFKQLLSYIDSTALSPGFGKDTSFSFYVQIILNTSDSSFSWYYKKRNGKQTEDFFKNCFPKTEKLNSDAGLIPVCAPALNFIASDTVAGIILTKPTKRKYEVYRSVCPGGFSKEQATNDFMKRALGQYQLIIQSDRNRLKCYFVAPPDPSSKFRLKHTTGHF